MTTVLPTTTGWNVPPWAHWMSWSEAMEKWRQAGQVLPRSRFSTDEAAPPYHVPVMRDEVLHFIQPGPGKLIFDGTLGGGGHTEAMLDSGAHVLAMDQDEDALAHAQRRLAPHAERVSFIHGNFRDYAAHFEKLGLAGKLDGILLDLGVSSWQLDSAERGFSFQHDGPLDMRMDRSRGQTASDFLSTTSDTELKRIFQEYGEEPQAGRLARAIAEQHRRQPFLTTGELSRFVEKTIGRHGPKHPATRIFQALRIAINDELGALHDALKTAHHWLRPGGRLCLITFHSLEDRVVKHYLQHHSQEEIDKPEWPAPRPNPECYYRLVVRKGLAPSDDEIRRNPRARSARLRVAERHLTSHVPA